MAVNPNDFRVQRVLDWLCTPPNQRDPRTQNDLAEELGMGPGWISQLKNDGSFLRLWEDRYRKEVGNPAKIQEVLHALQETAADRTDPRQVPAARAYLEALDLMKPRKVDVTVTSTAAKALTDEQLTEMIAARAAQELLERQETS
jgi:transcriptional regulator with XRE-family HTH domain